jgi:hypothetical protein
MGEIEATPELGLFELEVSMRHHRDVPAANLCVWTIFDLVIQSVVTRDGFAKAALGVDLLATPHSDIRKIRKTIHAAI